MNKSREESKVYGRGQPIVPPSPSERGMAADGQKKTGLKNKIFGGIKKFF